MSDSGDIHAASGGDTVCGVVVRAWPARTREVKRHLAQMAGVEVHAAGEDGRMIVTVEGGDEGEVADAVLALHRLEGVLSASLVYHHHEGPSTHSHNSVCHTIAFPASSVGGGAPAMPGHRQASSTTRGGGRSDPEGGARNYESGY